MMRQRNGLPVQSEKDGKSGVRRRRLSRWLVFTFICFATVGVAVWLVSPRPYDSGPLMERLLAAGPGPTPFSTVAPHDDWDTICYLDPYDTPSLRLPRHLGAELTGIADLTGFTYEPYDQIISEEEIGLLETRPSPDTDLAPMGLSPPHLRNPACGHRNRRAS